MLTRVIGIKISLQSKVANAFSWDIPLEKRMVDV